MAVTHYLPQAQQRAMRRSLGQTAYCGARSNPGRTTSLDFDWNPARVTCKRCITKMARGRQVTEAPEIIGSHEAARILGVSLRTAQRVLRDAGDTGEIPVIYEAHRGKGVERFVTREAVERYATKDS